MYLDGKQILKKQMAKENKEKIERLNRKDRSPSMYTLPYDSDGDDALDEGNE
jgi:hypothetical protein